MGANHREISRERAPATQLLVDRDDAALFVYRLGSNWKYHRRKFPIAVGKIGKETPSGAFYIDAKSREPSWWVPEDPDYPESLWGEEIPFEEGRNPFAGGFISISGGQGVGIHGVRFDPDLETTGPASHGCIRVAVTTLNYLYQVVPLGTPVIIL